MTMVESFEKQGTWWLPGQEKRVHGALSFDPKNGISVALSEPLAAGSTDNQTHTSKIIHGISSDGNKISLLDCFEYITKTHFRNHGIFPGARLIAKQCVVGAHLSESTKFNNHNFILHNFLQFFCRTGIRPEQNHFVCYAWDKVDQVVFPIGEDKITIEIHPKASFHFFENTASIKEYAVISINMANPVGNLDEVIMGYFQTIKTMLEFSLGYPVPIVQFQAVATDVGEVIGESIEIFFSQSVYLTEKIGIPQQDMLFSFCGKSDGDISEFAGKWHVFYNQNRFTVDVIINSGVKSSDSKHAEESFFFLISSLEALQRGHGTRKLSISEDEFNEMKKLIFDVLPHNETGDMMRNRIGNMNKPSLRQALHDVLNATQQHFSHRGINKDILVSNFINFRTLLAHQIGHSEINDNVIFKWHLTEVLWGITVIYVLKLLGFSNELLDDIVKNRRNMLNALNWIGEVSSKSFDARTKKNIS